MSKPTFATFVTLCCALCLFGITTSDAAASKTLSYISGMRVRPFADSLQSSEFFMVDGATVSIEFGYAPGKDILLLDYEGEFDLTTKFEDGILFIYGDAPASEYASAISTVMFMTQADDGQSRRITWTYGKDTLRMTLTGHYYKYVKYAGAWSSAVTSCKTNKYMNMQGYLATITSADEMAEVGGKAQFSAWVGGSDSGAEGMWKWMTGPEAGSTFWAGASQYQGGMAVNDSYTKWYRFQPNNGNGDGQNFLAIKPSVVPSVAYIKDDSDIDGVAGYICEYGGMDSDAIASTMDSYSNTVVVAFDCSLYSLDPASCSNHKAFGCTYNGVDCAQQDCSRFTDEMQCSRDWKCSWSTNGFIGQCGNTRCGKYSDAATCADDSACYQTTVGGSSQCLNKKCAHALSPAHCADIEDCSWVQGQCAYDKSANCDGQDVVYMLDGSAAMATEWSRFSTGFQGLTDLFLNSQPTLAATSGSNGQRVGFVQYGPVTMQSARDQVPPSTTGSGGMLTGTWSKIQADLQFQQARFAPAEGRTISSALNTAKNMLLPAGETTTRKKVLVIFAAGAIADAVGVAKSNLVTSDLSGVTIIGVAIRPNTQSSNSANDALKSLQAITANVQSVPINDVTADVIYGTCNKNTTVGAAVFGSAAYPNMLCNSFYTPNSCETNPQCAWDDASNSCRRTSCMLNTRQSTCEPSGVTTTCTWDSALSLCKQKCPGLNQASCTGACAWSAGQCLDAACLGNPTEDSCIADPAHCRFFPTSNPSCQPLTCEAQTNNGAAACQATSGCLWVNNKECTRDVCAGLTSTTCPSSANCEWTGTACTFNKCGKHQNEVDCSATTQCEWSVAAAPGACVPAKCTKYNVVPATAQQNCAMESGCMWGGEQLRCQVKQCDMLNSSAACSTLNSCVWRNNQCKESRFVQCPAIDAIFLVEATPIMLKAFGRHPNGFYGIIEQLRQWGMDAPFSKDETSTGFRMKLQLYGARTSPAFPTTGYYPKFGEASQPSWTGAGGELYSAESSVAGYARGVNTADINITTALKDAKTTFASDNVTGRTKMVIILGHSAISDNGVLNTYVADLEAAGVQIFSNLIRRFSSITANEQVAANFLKPLSSDPQSSHFSFTTIDAMRQNLLDRFCDPSTGTGQALGISRDRTLPCNWLDGKDECEIQGSCVYNESATPICPLPTQCPNLGCAELPAALAKKFRCENCKLSSGAFQCDAGAKNVPKLGLCQTDPCMLKDQASCTGGCSWNLDKQRCDRTQCGHSTEAGCNADLACVWVDSGLSGNSPSTSSCRKSVCGLMRTASTCGQMKTTQAGASAYKTCSWKKTMTPGICAEARCPNLDETSCRASPATCGWKIVAGRQCQELTCQYTSNARCEADANCFWDRFDTNGKNCKERTGTCVMSGYSNFTQCSATCGPAVRYKARTIVSFPDSTNPTCAEVAAQQGASASQCGRVPNCNLGDTKIVESRSCTTASTSCASHCSSYGSNVLGCMNDISCVWKSKRCQPAPVYGCSTITNETACNLADSCAWSKHTQFCDDVVKECKNATSQAACSLQGLNCAWNTGVGANSIAASLGIPSILINPGQKEIFVFPNLRIESTDRLSGAAVTIETNYSRGKDLLELTYPSAITATWVAQSGTLYLNGGATVSDYAAALRYVTFFTTSTSKNPRKITWSFRRNTIFSATTGHHYTAFWQSGVTWDQAKTACANSQFYGLNGYLATVQSEHENTLLSTKLNAEGWISGDDTSRNQWRYSTGPSSGTPFWTGPSAILGGYQNADGYSNWDQEQPLVVSQQGFNHPYLNVTGYWTAQAGEYAGATGYVCEYGGLITDTPFTQYSIGGATLVTAAGCVAHMCEYHADQTNCARDSECTWVRGSCKPGCSSLSSMADCERSAHCKWDTTTLPATCDTNICVGLGSTACAAASYACMWTAGQGCKYRSGCAIYTAQANCSKVSACAWTASTSVCETKPCSSFNSEVGCAQNALCEWNAGLKVCASAICKYGTEGQCTNDRRCTWSAATSVAAAFPPGGSSILPFTTGVPLTFDTTTLVDGITVAIVEGFQKGQDMLTVLKSDNIAGNYKVTYNRQSGVLTLTVVPGVEINRFQAFQFIQKSVRFYSTSNNLVRRRLQYALGLRMLADSQHTVVYKYLPTTKPVQTMAAAQAACATWANDFGFWNATVAQIGSQIDNLRLAALGAQGWLGATVATGSNNKWVWMATPVANTQREFWTGVGARGSPFKQGNFTGYAQWAGGEPKPGTANTYAFFAQTGFWKVVNETSSAIQTGVICQAPIPNNASITAERNVKPSGCYLTPCLSVPKAQCKESTQCVWVESDAGGSCSQDTWCTKASNPSKCGQYELCYWDYDAGSCRTAAPNSCSLQNFTSCTVSAKCNWRHDIVPRNPTSTGVCTFSGCGVHPKASPCTADPTCRWAASSDGLGGTCVKRLCGYVSEEQCWTDKQCSWNGLISKCAASSCLQYLTADTCLPLNSCSWDDNAKVCNYERCKIGLTAAQGGKAICQEDNKCLWDTASGKCTMPACNLATEKDCKANPKCYFTFQPNRCLAAQCTSNDDLTTCEQGVTELSRKPCIWESATSSCRQLTFAEQNAPPSGSGMCEQQTYGNLWWLWALAGLILLLIIGIFYRLYLAYSKGLSFFEPAKKTKQFSPHAQFGEELFEEAQQTGVETNVNTKYTRPTADEL